MKRTKHVGIRRFAAVALSLILCVTMAPLGVWAEGGISLSDGDVPDFPNAVKPNNLSVQLDGEGNQLPQQLVTADESISGSGEYVIRI